VVVAIPAVMSVTALLQEAPLREGEPAPRTVIAPDLIRVDDPAATELARRLAADAVEPVLVSDDEAKAAVVQAVSDRFAAAEAARQPATDGVAVPSMQEQVQAILSRIPVLEENGARRLASLPDNQLSEVAAQAIDIAQLYARDEVPEGQVEADVNRLLRNEFAVRTFPPGVADEVIAPIIRDAARPTVRLDDAKTEALRSQAADDVAPVQRTFARGSVIVSAGEVVDPQQYAALQLRGLEGREPWLEALRALALVLALTAVVALYLQAYRRSVWQAARKLLLLAVIALMYVAALETASLLVPAGRTAMYYAVPVGAVAMLATILFDPPVGVLLALPATVLVAFTVPGEAGVVAFAAVASLLSVPLVSRLSARGDLRRAAWQSTLGYAGIAAVMAAVFSGTDSVLPAAAAGLANGVISAVVLNGSLPFLESVFGILTATSLLDLADRNHPLLRELERKALGSYNHSIMVSTMCERAARSIHADSLLASTAALYHDIGKVRRPYFFVENQFGIENPHDELPPEQSALIIQDHVSDGVEMARQVRLPPEIVGGIASHHGTTLVSFFYSRAVAEADADPAHPQVDEAHFRYKGRKPSSKEMGILMLADCCEGASRAAAQHNRNLSRDDLDGIVRGLVADRVEDGQLDECALTFRELADVQESFIETLVGVYHPRIAYPGKPRKNVPANSDVVAAGARRQPGKPAEAQY